MCYHTKKGSVNLEVDLDSHSKVNWPELLGLLPLRGPSFISYMKSLSRVVYTVNFEHRISERQHFRGRKLQRLW